ncbi:tyrosine-type recombinase/integrase [Candidatus Dojkabacteria bacterium]|uniref:Tyrosine-type recombinase/integrase n=1 Tax=Candidatus Dojkabacteria bacterium TaxID=2099670 RepID=A0A955L3R3_9BACT|nr:tyrosine-type recombinase/integrase [Candidatus Dojkabacteria bacterium]
MLNDLINQFVDFLNSKNRSSSTIIAYRKDLEQLADFCKGKGVTDINLVTIDMLRDFLNSQRELGFKEKTISRKINSIKTFYRFLSSEGKVKTNVARELEHPKIENVPPHYLTKMEYMALRDVSRRNIRNYTIIELILQTGLRISEIANLKTQNVKLKSSKPHLVIEPYESNAGRKVYLNNTAIEALENYFKNYDPKTGFFFTTKTGKQLLVRNIRASISRLLEKAGINNATINDLRNTYIVHYLKEGMPVDKVAKQVGHKRTSTTQRYVELIDPKEIKKNNRRYEDL